MTDEQIEQLAQRVAKIILDKLHEGLLIDMQPDEEEDLLAELARCMTLMSKYLAEEKYEECELLKKKNKNNRTKIKKPMMKPMLAHKYDEKRIDWSEPVYIQPKLDGVRCLFTKDGAYSRTGKKFMNLAHIELALIPFFKQQPDIVLDGELYNHELKDDFEKIYFISS